MLAASSASGSWQYLLARRRQASASFNWNGPWQFLAINCSRNDHIQCWDKNYEKRKILSTFALSRSPGFMSEPWKIIVSFQQRKIKGWVKIVLNQMLRRRLPKDTWSGCVFSWAVLQIPSPVPFYGGRPPFLQPAHWLICYIFPDLLERQNHF